jgi:hypothetical protein
VILLSESDDRRILRLESLKFSEPFSVIAVSGVRPPLDCYGKILEMVTLGTCAASQFTRGLSGSNRPRLWDD